MYLVVVASQNPEISERACFLKLKRADLKKRTCFFQLKHAALTKRACFFQFEHTDLKTRACFFESKRLFFSLLLSGCVFGIFLELDCTRSVDCPLWFILGGMGSRGGVKCCPRLHVFC